MTVVSTPPVGGNGPDLGEFPKSSKGGTPLTLREKFEIVRKWKVEGQDPKVFMPPYFAKHGRPVPLYPVQAISMLPALVRHLVRSGNPEAVKLAYEFFPDRMPKKEGGEQ